MGADRRLEITPAVIDRQVEPAGGAVGIQTSARDPEQVGQLLRRRLVHDGVASRAAWLESHDREKDIYYVGGYPVIVAWDTDGDEYAAALAEGITALTSRWDQDTAVPSDWYDRSTYQSPLPGVVIAHQ